MGNSAALLGGIAAAAPGLAQGGQALATNIGNYDQGNTQGIFGNAANQLNTITPAGQRMGSGGGSTDPLTAAMTTAAPPAGGAPPPSMALNGVPAGGAAPAAASPVPTKPTQPVQGVGGIGQLVGAAAGATGMQRGGVVPEHLDPIHRAANIGALGSGVVPASTTGQVLTFDQGGVVPGGNSMSTSPDFQQAQTPQVPMTGPAAGFVQGFGAGQAIGRNLLNAWNEHNARQDAAKYADAADAYNPGGPPTPAPSTNPSPMGQLQDHVEQFFSHLKSLTLGDNGQPNHKQGVPDPALAPVPGSGPQPAQAIPAGTPPTAQAAPQGGAPPPPTPGGPPPPPPPGGAPGGPPAQMGGNPSAPPPGSPDAQAAAQQAQAGQQKGMTAAAVQQGQQQSQQDQAQGQPDAKNAPHSLTTDDYDNLQHLKMRAVHSAILAGKDPNTVYNSMNALETAHFQSQITRYMSNAQAALQHGDMDGVKQSLANANYYLPNGQDINMKTATQQDVSQAAQANGGQSPFKVGDLMVEAPTYGMPGGSKQQYVPVTMQTLQLEGQNLLDPTKVAGIISGTYAAQSEARLREQQGQADLTNANARWVQANGIANWRNGEAYVQKASLATKLQLMRANGELDQAKALKLLQDNADAAGKGPKVTAGAAQTASKAAGQAAQSAMLGPQTVINDPVTGQHISHDTTKVDPNYAGFSAAQQNDVLGLAQGIAAANVGSVSAQDAAGLAAQIVRFQSQGGNATHSEGGKTYKNYVFDAKTDTGHIWVPSGGGKGSWRVFRGTPNIASAEPGIDVGGGGGQTGAEPESDSGAGTQSNDDIPND
jgi:hypothetical protein